MADDDGDDFKTVDTKGKSKKKDKSDAPDDDDGGEFTQYWRTKAMPNYLMSDVLIRWMSDKWNKYFETITGRKMDPPFEFSPSTYPYASSMESRRNLDNIQLGLCSARPTVWDLTCGSGSDAIIFALFYNCWKLHAVDSMDAEEFQRTIRNVRSYGNVFPQDYPNGSIVVEGETNGKLAWSDSCKIAMHNTPIKQFITSYSKRVDVPKCGYHTVDFCYIDPSWCAKELLKSDTKDENVDRNRHAYDYQHIPETLEQEANPDIVMRYVVNQIIKPIEDATPKIFVAVLCLKVRFELSSKVMQDYLDKSGLSNRFVVLYAVQALPNVDKRHTKEVNGKIVIMEYDRVTHGMKEREGIRLDDVKRTKIIKGQFHWLVMKNVTYKLINDSKREWAEKEMLGGHPQPVYVLKGTAMTGTFKPEYGDKVSERSVLTKDEFVGLKPKKDQEKYEEIEAVRSVEEVHEEDMQAYTGMLNELDGLLDKESEEYDKQKVIDLIENILLRADAYQQKRYTSVISVELRRAIFRLESRVVEFYRITGKIRKIIEEGKTKKPLRVRADLDALLQQLRGL
jgi:hypothetical protein